MIPARVDISQRPKIVESSSRLGDWEGDTVYGQDPSLVTLLERKSLLTLIGKITNKTAETVFNMMINMLNRRVEVVLRLIGLQPTVQGTLVLLNLG